MFVEAIFYEKKHFFWSHLEVRNLHPAHFILLPAHCSSYDICILCRAGTLIAWKCLQICCQKKQVVKKKREKKCDCMVIMCDCLKANMGRSPVCLLLLPSQNDSPLPTSACSLPLLCSLSEDRGEPVSPCDEGLLWDAAAVCGPGHQSWTEVTRCWRRSVAQNSIHTTDCSPCVDKKSTLWCFLGFFNGTEEWPLHTGSLC